jgi:hypothetical protein
VIAADIAAALAFTWLGLILAISFIEAPLKFRAPGVTIRLGLGIGRVVFRAVNRVEIAFCALIVGAAVLGSRQLGGLILIGLTVLILIVQLTIVRPRLNRRSDLVLAGGDAPERSSGHVSYIVLEIAKAIVLTAMGIAFLS